MQFDLHNHVIEVPLVAGAGAPAAQPVGVGLPELHAPGPDGFIADHHTTRKHHLLDLAKAQREPVIAPTTDRSAPPVGLEERPVTAIC